MNLTTKKIIPYFLEERRPEHFINSSSTSSKRWKMANMIRFRATKGLAVKWTPHNIRVNAVCPLVGDTAMMPVLGGQDSSTEAYAKKFSAAYHWGGSVNLLM